MKKIIITAALLIAAITVSVDVNAQKYCYISTEYILENIPEYTTAQQNLDQLSVQWQKEIEKRYAEIDKLYKAYQSEQVLLTEEMRKKREEDIITKEKEVKDYQKQKFGFEGDLFKKKQELVKPIQDKIFNTVKKYAEDNSYAIIFDKSSDLTMLYSSPKYDKSDAILKAMGYKAGTPSNTAGTTTSSPTSGGKETPDEREGAPKTGANEQPTNSPQEIRK